MLKSVHVVAYNNSTICLFLNIIMISSVEINAHNVGPIPFPWLLPCCGTGSFPYALSDYFAMYATFSSSSFHSKISPETLVAVALRMGLRTFFCCTHLVLLPITCRCFLVSSALLFASLFPLCLLQLPQSILVGTLLSIRETLVVF